MLPVSFVNKKRSGFTRIYPYAFMLYHPNLITLKKMFMIGK